MSPPWGRVWVAPSGLSSSCWQAKGQPRQLDSSPGGGSCPFAQGHGVGSSPVAHSELVRSCEFAHAATCPTLSDSDVVHSRTKWSWKYVRAAFQRGTRVPCKSLSRRIAHGFTASPRAFWVVRQPKDKFLQTTFGPNPIRAILNSQYLMV